MSYINAVDTSSRVPVSTVFIYDIPFPAFRSLFENDGDSGAIRGRD